MGSDRKGALGVEEARRYLGGLSRRTLMDGRWRRRIGLPATKLGRRLVFAIADLDRLLARGKEKLPRPAGDGGEQ